MVDYFVEGKGKVSLTQKDYLTEGGEGRIYKKTSTIYKIYIDTTHMVPAAKIRELSKLDNPYVVKPDKLVLDLNQNPVGHTMKIVPDNVTINRLFTTEFRNKNNITPESTINLIKNMKNTFEYLHSNNVLVVDANENNFLIPISSYLEAYFIDTCSYQIPGYPATAIMANIRDYHNTNFSKLTDWYSFGIIACQLILGIHPFTGKHPSYKKNDFINKMKDNISIFNNNVTIPAMVRDLSLIPVGYKDWFIHIFESNNRSPPPDNPGKFEILTSPVNAVPVSGGKIKGTIINSYDATINDISNFFTTRIIYFNNKITVGSTTFFINEKVVFSETDHTPYKVWTDNKTVFIASLKTNHTDQLDLYTNRLTIINNRLYSISSDKITELKILELSVDKLVPHRSWNLLNGKTDLYTNVLYSNIMGTPYFIIPPKSRECYFLPIKELSSYKISNAKYLDNVLIVIGQKNSEFTRFIIKFNSDFSEYKIRKTEQVLTADINFTVLSTGVVVLLLEDGILELFSNSLSNNSIKEIHDNNITTKMLLFSDNNVLICSINNILYRLTLL